MDKTTTRIAMLSTHGYFDPAPVLGRTDTGGQVVYVLELARALSRKGYPVDIFTRWFDRKKPQVEVIPDCPDARVVRINAGPWEFIPKEFIYDVLPELSENMIRFIEKEKLNYHLFHGHYVDAGVVTLDAAAYFNKPSYFTAHSLGAWKREQMGGDAEEMEAKFNFKLRTAEETRILNAVAGNSVTTDLQLDKLKQLYKYEKENVEVIAPGVDIHRFNSKPGGGESTVKGLPEKYIYCLSRIDTNKGHDMLLEAFHELLQLVPDAHLVIGGGSPNPKPREKKVFDKMHDIISKYNMGEQIQFVGYVPDDLMAEYYQQARIFVLPSLFEPFGMTTQEAMACGTPVVASKYGGIRTVISNGKDGILVDPKDAKEFANEIAMLLTDNDWNNRIGKAGQKLIREHYSWEVIARKHLDFYSHFANLSFD